MTIRQLATYLSVNERTVLKLVQDGTLPGVKVGNQWRFRKAMVDTWLDDQALGITPRQLDLRRHEDPRRMLSLSSCFKQSHIIPEVEETAKIGVIAELAAYAARVGLVRDETWFVGALIQRENVMPSATGNGVAFLHTLRRHPNQIVEPFMILGRSRSGVDFDSLDGQPTHLFFVLGLKFEELQLPWLAKLTQMLAQTNVVRSLIDSSTVEDLYDGLMSAERQLSP
jgi:excisionase family DNA binding protein